MNVIINYTVEQIAAIVRGRFLQKAPGMQPSYLLLDSRKLISPEATIFFALKTPQRKATEFIKDLYGRGVRSFITDDEGIDVSAFAKANFILVDDTLEALQLLAIHHRRQFNIPVIGITGSNGKTIVKEWLNQLLEKDFNKFCGFSLRSF